MNMFKLVMYYIIHAIINQLIPTSCSYLEKSLRYTTLNNGGGSYKNINIYEICVNYVL